MLNLLKQSSTAQALLFLMIDSSDHITGKTGLSPTVTLRKESGSFGSPSGSVTEIANGWYQVAGNATDTNTLGSLVLHATGTGADPCDAEYCVVAFDPLTATNLGLSALPTANPGATNGLTIAGSNAATTFATLTVSGATTLTGNVSLGGTLGVTGTTTFTGAVTCSAGLAAAITGNITGNLSGSVGSVTGNVGGNVTGSVGSVVGAVGSVTGAVGSVTGNVGGNVVGSVASVSGNVGGTVNGITAACAAQFFTLNSTKVFSDAIAGSVVFEIASQAALPVRKNTATAGGSTSITLDAGASATNDIYTGEIIVLTSGTGIYQTRPITAYNGSTKVVTVTPAWATNPDNTTQFAILPFAPASVSGSVTVGGYSAGQSPAELVLATPANKLVTDGSGFVTASSVTGAVGSVTGNVTGSVGSVAGNVSGSVASVVGAVGSVTGNVGGNVTGTIGGMTSAAAALFFTLNSGTTYASAISGSVVKEIASNAGGTGGVTVSGFTMGALTAFWSYAYATWSALATSTVGGWIAQQLGFLVSGAGQTIVSPVTATGELTIIQMTAYEIAAGTPITFVVTSTVDITAYTGKLGLSPTGAGSNVVFPSTDITSLGGGQYRIRFELTAAQTAALTADLPVDPSNVYQDPIPAYNYLVTVIGVGSNCYAKVYGPCFVVANTIGCT